MRWGTDLTPPNLAVARTAEVKAAQRCGHAAVKERRAASRAMHRQPPVALAPRSGATVRARGKFPGVGKLAVIAVASATLSVWGCANRPPPSEYLTLRTGNGSQQLSLATTGQIVGPTMQLDPTQTGYRGMANSAIVDLRSDGERIVGTIHDQMVDLHVSVADNRLTVQGMFAGRLGRLDASNVAIKSSLGRCHYELEAIGGHYEGQRACGRSSLPMPHPAAIELPPGFERLHPDRQAMLLAILLGQ